MKRMFVVMEVKNIEGNDQWVRPIDSEYSDGEGVRKSRVIYADEMRMGTSGPSDICSWYAFDGVSPTPESDPWDEWIEEYPKQSHMTYGEHDQAVKNWFRNMPKRT